MARRKAKFAAGIVVIVLSLVYLVVSGFQNTAMYYFTVSELEAREADFVDKRIKLAGKVVPGSIQVDGQTLSVRFRIWEPVEGADDAYSKQRAVTYTGVVPDTFKDEADVILEGKTGSDGVFQAETLLAKCPSKYEGKSYEEMAQAHNE
ncbi:MAG: cytochrome c maturation protein CcmE [Candidatus Latescibacteria bacterium]|jgi:cytochrome c-type biogenesis protein CcmE|nr:cytochrome c maturation protein CcmE [Candidatus Latescibacterota bacterium]